MYEPGEATLGLTHVYNEVAFGHRISDASPLTNHQFSARKDGHSYRSKKNDSQDRSAYRAKDNEPTHVLPRVSS